MVILSSSGFQQKDKCSSLLKLIKNKKVFICTNGIDRDLYISKQLKNIYDLADEQVERIDDGQLTADNAYRYTDYYDCIYITEGNLRKLSEMLNLKEIKEALLKFVQKGKLLITEGLACHLVSDNLEYISYALKSIEESDGIYKFIDYAHLNTLALTKDKFIVHSNALPKKFKGACRLAEKNYRMTITHINDGDFVVL